MVQHLDLNLPPAEAMIIDCLEAPQIVPDLNANLEQPFDLNEVMDEGLDVPDGQEQNQDQGIIEAEPIQDIGQGEVFLELNDILGNGQQLQAPLSIDISDLTVQSSSSVNNYDNAVDLEALLQEIL